MLEGHKIDLNLSPQDFFSTREAPVKIDIHELETLLASQFRNVAVPMIVI
jgi:hypothetical protein